MRSVLKLLGLIVVFVLCGCPDGDEPVQDAAVQDAAIDTSNDAATDAAAGDISTVTPGCTTTCSEGQVCNAGKCETPGPQKACGSTIYGDGVPTTGKVLYVNQAATGTEKGTKTEPYHTISKALADVPDPSTDSTVYFIAVATGSGSKAYQEALTIKGNVTLHCRCATGADRVEIVGSIKVENQTSPISVAIDGCNITAKKDFSSSPEWKAGCKAPESDDGTAADRGIKVNGGSQNAIKVQVRESVIVGHCVGIQFKTADTSSSSLCVSRSRIWANHRGIDLFKAPLNAAAPASDCTDKDMPEAVAVKLSQIDQNEHSGVYTRNGSRGIALKANLVSKTGVLGTKSTASGAGFGVYLGNTDSAHILSNVINENKNVGLGLINDKAPTSTTFVISSNVLKQNKGAGITLQNLQATKTVEITGNWLKGTQMISGKPGGDGIQVIGEKANLYDMLIKGNTVIESKRHNILVEAVTGAVKENIICSAGMCGIHVQLTNKVQVSSNTFIGNGMAKTTIVPAGNPTEKISTLPTPIP